MSKKGQHADRNDLGKEAPLGDAGQIICLVIFLITWITDSFIFRFSTFLADYIPLYLNLPMAAIIFIPAFYFGINAHRIIFKEERNPPEVINKGVFKFMRHPLYSASLLFYIGLIISTLSLFSLILWVGIFIFHDYMAAFEEKDLEKKFGRKYLEYKKNINKWIPTLFRKN